MNNKVTLLGFYGGDETHALSAWQSTNIELGIDIPIEIQDRIHALYTATIETKKKSTENLLTLLASAGHHTPFEKSCLHFQVTSEIASHIHALKHRIGISINSESARYKELEDKWYLPDDWTVYADIQEETFGVLHVRKNQFNWSEILEDYTALGHYLYHNAVQQLTPDLGRKRAKESARYFLNYNKQLDYDMMFNFRSFHHFLQLRNSPHAQLEIREIAADMLKQVQQISDFQLTLKAFGYETI